MAANSGYSGTKCSGLDKTATRQKNIREMAQTEAKSSVFLREPRLVSQHPHSGSQLSITAAPGDLKPLLGF